MFASVALASPLSVQRLGAPDSVVFDEYHFGRFLNNYLTGNYLFDIHPPLGKLTMAAWGYVMCVAGRV